MIESVADASSVRTSQEVPHVESREEATLDNDPQHQNPFPAWLPSILSYFPIFLVTFHIFWIILDPTLEWLPKRLRALIATFSSFVSEDEIGRNDETDREADPNFNKGFLRQRQRVNRMIMIALAQCIVRSLVLGWTMIDSDSGRFQAAGVSLLFTWTFILFRLISKPPQTPSLFLLFLFLLLEASILLMLFEMIPQVLSRPSREWLNWRTVGQVSDLVSCSIEIFLILTAPVRAGGYEAVVPLQERIRLEKGEMIAEQEDVKKGYESCPTSPEDFTNLLSVLTYSWMNPIQALSLKRSLLPSDIWKLRKINEVETLSNNFRSLRSTRSSLITRILTANAQDILKDILFKTTGVSLAYAGPALMKSILESIQAASKEDTEGHHTNTNGWTPRQRAFVFACITLLLTTIRFISELLNFHAARQVGLRIRITLVVECFEKALRRRDLSGAVEEENKESGADVGKIVNMIANDINTLLRMGCDLHQLYGAPAEAIVATILLYRILGTAALIGLSILILAIPINYFLGNRNFKLQKAYSASRDVRISLNNETLGSIKHLKLMGVESQWREKVLSARENELQHLLSTRINGFMLNLFWSVVPILVSFTSFFYYIKVQGQELTVPVAFTSITLFSLIRNPLNVIPTFFLLSLQALVSVRRLEGFLNEEEVEEAISSLSTNPSTHSDHSKQLSLDQATFSWHGTSNSQAFQLKNLSIDFPQCGLIVIVGPTSSGKSSLLAALLGEMKLESGSVRRDKFANGKSEFSFAGQTPWLEAGRSIKNNIIFTSPPDEERYRQVIKASALEEDLVELEDGDETRVSSHTLSGGQKARIGFARALYSSSHTLILDDVFAAVDTSVQTQLYKALQGPLTKGRRVILVTHHLKLVLKSVDHLILLRKGEVEAQGSPAEIQSRGLLKDLILEEERPPAEIGNENFKHENGDKMLDGVDGTSGKRKSGKDPKLLYELEKRRQGSVRWSFWSLYIRASSPLACLAVILFTITMRFSSTLEQFWLKLWGEAYNRTSNFDWYLKFPPASGHESFYLNGLALIGLSTILFQFIRLVFFYVAEMRASRSIYSRLLSAVTRAPLRFFNVTPQGRILQRFTGDQAVIDDELPATTMAFLMDILALANYLTICLIITPGFLVPSLILFGFGPWFVRGFLASTRDMQRIESTSTSPMYSQFQEALEGISVIRAFGAEKVYLDRIIAITSATMSQWWAICTIEVWLSFRSQIAGGVAVFLVTLLALSGAVSVGSAGLVMTSAALLTQITYYVINDFKHLNNNINSVERISEYMDMEKELSNQAKAPAAWPSTSGSIVVKNLSMRYSKDLPEVLKNISFDIKPCEKIGIVGRTGSGKTSLISAFFRANEYSGSIHIDDVDIGQVDLENLRRRLVIVPQDPVLFSGSIRSSLDPFDEYSDEEIINVLKQVQLAGIMGGDSSFDYNSFLESSVSAGGSNFSSGAAQLLSLARALLRDSRVVILDEATSSTDLETDALIQKAIRSMSQSIVICVAHRLKTIIDYDRIIVMKSGQIEEFDTPYNLLSKSEGAFKSMCRGSKEHDELRKAAGLL